MCVSAGVSILFIKSVMNTRTIRIRDTFFEVSLILFICADVGLEQAVTKFKR